MIARYLHSADFQLQKKSHQLTNMEEPFKLYRVIKKSIMCKVVKGDTIFFCYDNWIKNNNSMKLLGLSEESVPNLQAKVCEFVQQDLS